MLMRLKSPPSLWERPFTFLLLVVSFCDCFFHLLVLKQIGFVTSIQASDDKSVYERDDDNDSVDDIFT